MGNCAWFGNVSRDWVYRERIGKRERERERESITVLSDRELDGGRRATMWVSPHIHLNGHLCLLAIFLNHVTHK